MNEGNADAATALLADDIVYRQLWMDICIGMKEGKRKGVY